MSSDNETAGEATPGECPQCRKAWDDARDEYEAGGSPQSPPILCTHGSVRLDQQSALAFKVGDLVTFVTDQGKVMPELDGKVERVGDFDQFAVRWNYCCRIETVRAKNLMLTAPVPTAAPAPLPSPVTVEAGEWEEDRRIVKTYDEMMETKQWRGDGRVYSFVAKTTDDLLLSAPMCAYVNRAIVRWPAALDALAARDAEVEGLRKERDEWELSALNARQEFFAAEQQVRDITAKLTSAEAAIRVKDEALDRLARNGIHADITPTVMGKPPVLWWYEYLKSADTAVRNIARAALPAAPVTEGKVR
jgi:hypothetical protein